MSYKGTLFGLPFNFNPIAFSIPIGKGHWDIYWYGIIIAIGFLLALIYALKNAARFNINTDRMLDVVLVVTPVSIFCARLYYVLFDGEKLTGIKDFFGFGESSGFAGIAIYGGVIGAFASGALMCRLRKIKIFDMFDLAAIGFILGQGIGRWGNFMNQEAYGSFTGSSWWGMQSNRTAAEMGKGLVHPCFLYESIWCIAGFFVLHYISKKRKFSGEVALCYCIWYGFERAFIELLRTDSLMIGPLRVSSLLSFLICIAGIVLLVYFRKRQQETAAEGGYSSVFEEQSMNITEDTADEDAIEKEPEYTEETKTEDN